MSRSRSSASFEVENDVDVDDCEAIPVSAALVLSAFDLSEMPESVLDLENDEKAAERGARAVESGGDFDDVGNSLCRRRRRRLMSSGALRDAGALVDATAVLSALFIV